MPASRGPMTVSAIEAGLLMVAEGETVVGVLVALSDDVPVDVGQNVVGSVGGEGDAGSLVLYTR